MDKIFILERLMAYVNKFNYYNFKRGLNNNGSLMTKEQRELEIKKFSEKINNTQLFITDVKGYTSQQLKEMIEENLNQLPDVIFIDYIQKVFDNENPRLSIDNYLRTFTELIKKWGIAGVILSQTARKPKIMSEGKYENPMPIENELKETSTLEQFSAPIIFVWKPERYINPDSRNVNLVVYKARSGGFRKIIYLENVFEHYCFKEI